MSLGEDGESWSDDPVRMYLTQMGEIPLLTRQQEIYLAKKIEVTRRRFRTKLLECDYVIQQAYKVLKRVHEGELPFDRTVQVSVTDRLEKDQILGRLPHNLATLDRLLERNADDYRIATSKSQKANDRRSAWKRLSRRRRLEDLSQGAVGGQRGRPEPGVHANSDDHEDRRDRDGGRGSAAGRERSESRLADGDQPPEHEGDVERQDDAQGTRHE